MYQQIISFLNKYTITRIDSQTSVVTQVLHLSSSSSTLESYEDISAIPFMLDNKNSKDYNTTNLSMKTPTSFLIKDLIIPNNVVVNNDCNINGCNDNNKQSQKMLASILQTLSHHQQLNNKYILTLIHYQMFITNIPYTNQQYIESNLQTQRNNNKTLYNASYKPNYSNNTYQEQNSRIFNSKLQSQGHSQYTVKNMGLDHQNDGESLNNSNSIYQYNYEESDSVVMEQNKAEEYPKFSKLVNTASMKNTNALINSQVYNNNNSNRNNNSNNNHMNINININQNNKNNTNNISNGNVNIYGHGPHNAIRAIYQYGTLTLKQQIVNRIASSTQFQQQQLWAILATLVQALSYLQQQEIAYGVLGTDKIFINNSLVKVLDPSATASDPLLISQGRLYSPQILNDEQNIDIFKSDVYIIGLIILQCGLLIDLSKDSEPNLQKYKKVFSQQYSKQLLDVIQKCLNIQPNNRPNFQQLKQQIGKQLNWIDFSNNYQNCNNKILQSMNNDKQDQNNPIVQEIQLQYQQCNYDILYQNLNKQQLKKYKKINLTQYQRAKLKYLGNDVCLSPSNSINQQEIQGQNQQSHRIKNRQNNSLSPMESRKNGKYNSVKHYDSQNNGIYCHKQNGTKIAVPNLNMAISQSVYTDGSIPSSTKHRYREIKKPVKKYQRQNKQQIQKQKKQNKQQYINLKQYEDINNYNQKIKKTKLIKDKLVKNNHQDLNQNLQNHHKYGQQTKNLQHPHLGYNNHAARQTSNKDIKDNKYGESIQQQLYQQSESSYLYYNNNNNNNMNIQPLDKQNQNSKGSSVGESHVSQKGIQNKNTLQSSQSNLRHSSTTMVKNNGTNYRKSTNLQNISQYKQKYFVIKPLNKTEIGQNQKLFTDPNLLKTIKDDLARISTNKNLQNSINNIPQNRYGK